MSAWLIQVMGETIGPVSSAELQQRAARGSIEKDTLIKKVDDADWREAGSVEGLFTSATPSRPTAAFQAVESKKSSTMKWVLISFAVLFLTCSGAISAAISNAKKAAVAKAALKTPEEKRLEVIQKAFNVDGSHRQLCKVVKERLNDPASFQHVSTKYVDKDDRLILEMTYRAKNGFNALRVGRVIAEAEIDGTVLNVQSIDN